MDDERRYTAGGLRAHLVPRYTSGISNRALCGLEVFNRHYDWYGSGSQVEINIAAKLPLCKHCARKQSPIGPA